jgi:hypothetical protein
MSRVPQRLYETVRAITSRSPEDAEWVAEDMYKPTQDLRST